MPALDLRTPAWTTTHRREKKSSQGSYLLWNLKQLVWPDIWVYSLQNLYFCHVGRNSPFFKNANISEKLLSSSLRKFECPFSAWSYSVDFYITAIQDTESKPACIDLLVCLCRSPASKGRTVSVCNRPGQPQTCGNLLPLPPECWICRCAPLYLAGWCYSWQSSN